MDNEVIPEHVIEAMRILNAEGVIDRIKKLMDDSLKDSMLLSKSPTESFEFVQLFKLQEQFFHELGRELEESIENAQA